METFEEIINKDYLDEIIDNQHFDNEIDEINRQIKESGIILDQT